MKNKIRVLLVDSDMDQMCSIEKYFSSHAVINISKSISDGAIANEYIERNHNNIDVIVMDLLISNKDGMSIIKNIRDKGINTNIIVLTGYNSLDIVKQISLYNISYFMLKPFDYSDLEYQILNVKNYMYNILNADRKLQADISNLLHSLGVPSHIKGYEYIREGIGLMYNKPSLIGAITKEMYPAIAVKYNTTSSRVERAIRHAIEVSWARGDYDLMEDIFGHSVDYDKAKPTNSEFIATLADKIRLENM